MTARGFLMASHGNTLTGHVSNQAEKNCSRCTNTVKLRYNSELGTSHVFKITCHLRGHVIPSVVEIRKVVLPEDLVTLRQCHGGLSVGEVRRVDYASRGLLRYDYNLSLYTTRTRLHNQVLINYLRKFAFSLVRYLKVDNITLP